jgi:hypothetical protein
LAMVLLAVIGLIVSMVREVQLRQMADNNAQAAEKARKAERWEAYQARLTAALGLVQNHRMVEAARQLEAAPTELRGWEWRHLHSRLDDSRLQFSWPDGESRFALAWVAGSWRALAFPLERPVRLWNIARRDCLTTLNLEKAFQCWTLPSRNGTQFLLEQYQYNSELPGPLILTDDQGKELWRFSLPRHSHFNATALSPNSLFMTSLPANYGSAWEASASVTPSASPLVRMASGWRPAMAMVMSICGT